MRVRIRLGWEWWFLRKINIYVSFFFERNLLSSLDVGCSAKWAFFGVFFEIVFTSICVNYTISSSNRVVLCYCYIFLCVATMDMGVF